MSRVIAGCVLLLGSLIGTAVAQTCPLTFVGDVKQFVVEQENGKNRRTVPAVERAMTAKEFYDYRSASSHTGFERERVSNMFLFRDLNNPTHLSFFWTHGIDVPGKQPTAAVDALMTGIPEGVTIAQRDDIADEWDWTTHTTLGRINHQKGPSAPFSIAGHWSFGRNTDGGAIEGLPTNLNWKLKMETAFIQGINTWSFHFGDGSTAQNMDPAEPVYLHPVVTSVDTGVAPYPQTAGKETFCTLVESDNQGEMLTFTFKWGDETPDTVVTKAAGSLACAEHDFCGLVSATCGGTAPRKVRVLVSRPAGGCSPVDKILADEDVDDVSCTTPETEVIVGGTAVPPIDVNGMESFSNSEAVLTMIPENMRDLQVHTPAGPVAKGTSMKLSCCGTEACEFILSHYHCPPCSGKVNGGFPALLPVYGFESASCAPKWGLTGQRMVSYKVQVEAGGSLLLPPTTEEATSFVIFSKVGGLADPWCPKPTRAGCGGPCPPSKCECLANP